MSDDDLDRALDDFGGRLAIVARRHDVRKRRRLAPAGAAALTALAALGLLLGNPAGGGPGVVDRAQAALAPNGGIVHLELRERGAFTQVTEQWSADNPPRGRFVQDLGAATGGLIVTDASGARVDGRQEVSYGPGEQRIYDVDEDRLTIVRGARPSSQPGRGLLGRDPQNELRAALGRGKLVDEGVVTRAGRSVRRLTLRAGDRLLEYEVDPKTFAPVRLTVRFASRTGDPRFDAPLVLEVLEYERLPPTPRTEALLRSASTSRTKVVVVKPRGALAALPPKLPLP